MGQTQVGIALVWLILFSTSVLQARCSLAAYSETRSFRDALDGRSMEEALSGPVDKDTSSYGDRTSSSSGSTSSATSSAQPPAASSMMLSIPANGNLQQQQQQVDEPQQQQQKSMNGGSDAELEREAGPINGGTPMDGQQQLMEQKQFGRQVAQTARRMAGRYMQMQLQKHNARQQQQAVDDSSSGFSSKTSANNESGFGEEPQSAKGRKASESSLTTPSYSSNRQQVEQSKQPADNNEDQSGNEQQQQQQQQQMNVVEQQATERGYSSNDSADQQQQQAVKQRAMAAMLMSMNNAMKYSQRSSVNTMSTTMMPSPAVQMPIQQQQQAYESPNTVEGNENNVKGSIIPENPMQMSFGNNNNNNKLSAYGGQSMQANQRQIAPPMMMSTLMNQMQQSNLNNQGGKMRASRGGMRRAGQRRVEKKMSPSMVNAMLNKMLNMKPIVGEKEQQGYVKPAAMAMLMKSPAGAELLANMAMTPQMVGAMAGMPAAKKEQYKRMMMAAIMQQAVTEGRGNENSATQQQVDDSYSSTEQPLANNDRSAKTGARSGASARDYGVMSSAVGQTQQIAPMSPVAMMMKAAMNGGRGSFGSYEQNSQEQQQQVIDDATATTTMTPDNYANRMASGRKTANGKGGKGSYPKPGKKMMMLDFIEQQQMQQQTQMQSMAGKSIGMGRPPVNINKPVSMMTNSMSYAMSPITTMNPIAMNGNSDVNGRGMKTSLAGMNAGKYAGRQQQQIDEQQKSYNGYGDSEQQQQQQDQGEQMNEQVNGMSSYAGMMNEQQQEMTMSTQSPVSPRKNMANRLQSYSPMYSPRQQQSMSAGSGLKAGSTKGSQMPVQQMSLDDLSTPMPMARPMPVQRSYGANNDEQQQQLDESNGPVEQQQQKESDEFGGAAPMGMAEPFAFDYKVEDDYGNGHYRKEESDKNGVVRGSYGYMDVNGLYRHVDYVADENGFRANVKSNEPGLSNETSQANSGGATSSSVGNNNNNNNMNMNMNMNNSPMSNSAQNSPSSTTTSQMVQNQITQTQMMSMDAPSDSTPATIQQQQQQMLPTQTELNENGEK